MTCSSIFLKIVDVFYSSFKMFMEYKKRKTYFKITLLDYVLLITALFCKIGQCES